MDTTFVSFFDKVKPSAKEKYEDIILIWFDENNQIDTKEVLSELHDRVVYHHDPHKCVQDIQSMKNDKIFLVCYDLCSKNILSTVHNLRQIDGIYIFFTRKDKIYDQLNQEYSKIIGTFTNSQLLMRNIQENILLAAKQSAIFSLYDKKEKSTRDLSRESAEFLWFQILKDVLLKMPHTSNAKEEMLSRCRDYYRGNKRQLENIDKFERTYDSTKAIEWYTSTTFIFKLVNKALRTENIDLLYLFRFYFVDLCKMLKQEYAVLQNRQQSRNMSIFQLY